MIKINKNFNEIPRSLNSKETKEKLNEIIENKKYPNKKIINKFLKSLKYYNDSYKEEDVKNILKKIYHHKCCFCEQKIESFQIEHFRPKSTYYWLAYSWDNIFLFVQNAIKIKEKNLTQKKEK